MGKKGSEQSFETLEKELFHNDSSLFLVNFLKIYRGVENRSISNDFKYGGGSFSSGLWKNLQLTIVFVSEKSITKKPLICPNFGLWNSITRKIWPMKFSKPSIE